MPTDELVFLPLGGSGEIGMNFNAYGFGPPERRRWIVVDCGVTFGRETDSPGVDLILPDIGYLAERRQDVLAIIATHGHEDHIGAIALLWPMLRCPIYATPFTARLIEAKLEEQGVSQKVGEVGLGGRLKLGPFTVDFISITHSIPEPNLLAIRTSLGVVVHTGDWKLDPQPLLGKATDADAIRKLGEEGVLALVCDSTNALLPGHSGSESEVRDSLVTLVGGLKGRIAVTAFASNVARLDSIAHAACANGRKVALLGRSMHRIVEAARSSGYLKDFPSAVDAAEAQGLPPSRVLFLVTGSQGEPRAALARIAAGTHPDVRLGKGDAVIFSSRVIPGNEVAIFALHNRLCALGVEVLTAEEHFVHVSGHPAREELAEMYRWTRPRIAVPVHGELRHLSEHARLARSLQVSEALVPANGQLYRLAPGQAQLIDEVPSGRIHLDGRVLVGEGEGLAKARRAMGHAGLLAITLVLDGKGRPAADAAILGEGLPRPVADAVKNAVGGILNRHNPKNTDSADLQEAVRLAARRAALDAWGKKPVTRVTVVEL
ncbi:MAG: ribonuclease J [Rhizomicrobium sp.]